MGQGISEVLTFAVGVAISPVPIIAVILMLFSQRAKVNARRQAAVSQARRSSSKAFTTGACGAGQAGDATRLPPVDSARPVKRAEET